MDWIFDNLYLVIIILFGIISFLSNSGKKQEEQEKKQSTPPKNPTQTRQRQQRSSSQGAESWQQAQRKRQQPRAESQVFKGENRPDISAGSIEEQQRKQMERMTNRYQTSSQEELEDAGHSTDLKVERQNKEAEAPGKTEMKRRVSGNLDGEGLVNGIIMAEVLGSPRAKNPYRSIVQRRKSE